MPRLYLAAAVLALPLVLAACDSQEQASPGAVSPGEAKALEDAASMLDERRLPPGALPTDAPADAPADLTGDAAANGR